MITLMFLTIAIRFPPITFGGRLLCFGLGSGIRREIKAPNETKMTAVNAAHRVPCVSASKIIAWAAGQFAPKPEMKDWSMDPESPELRAAFNTDPIEPKLTALDARSACPTTDI